MNPFAFLIGLRILPLSVNERHLTRLLTLCAFLSFVLNSGFGTAIAETFGPVQWEVGDGGNGNVYSLVFPDDKDDISWFDARDRAALMFGGLGHLVTITSAAENEFLRGHFESHVAVSVFGGPIGDDVWIGLSDANAEGVYEWITGEPFSYSNWAPGEPNNLFNEDYIHIWRRDPGTGPLPWDWNDSFPVREEGNFLRVAYIVEAVPEPSSLFLLGLGAFTMMLFGSRRRGCRRPTAPDSQAA